jgi:5-methylthioadenosine/S-adenosylhomocysteine deaminase
VRGGDVDLVMVDGCIIVEDNRLKTADLTELIADVRGLAPGLFARRAAWLVRNRHGSVQWTDPNGTDGGRPMTRQGAFR